MGFVCAFAFERSAVPARKSAKRIADRRILKKLCMKIWRESRLLEKGRGAPPTPKGRRIHELLENSDE